MRPERRSGRTISAAGLLWLALATAQAQAQDGQLDGLLSGGGNPFELLGDIASGETPDATGGQGDALGEVLDLFGGALGGSAGAGAEQRAGTAPDELARARTCRQVMGNPLFNALVQQLLSSGFGVGATDPDLLRGLVGNLRRLPLDACTLRDILVMEALLDVLAGRYNSAAATLDTLLPEEIDPANGLALLAQAAHAAVLALQLREAEARELVGHLRPAVVAGLGADSRLLQMLDGAQADMDMALGRTARAEGDEARAQELFAQAERHYRGLAAELGGLPRAGAADELTCIALGSRGSALLLQGDAAGTADLLEALLDPAGACATVFPRDSLLGSSKLIDLGLARLALGELAAAEAALAQGDRAARALRGDAHPDVIRATRGLSELRALQGRPDEAVALLAEMDESLLTWLGGALRGTASQALRRRIAALQTGHQDLALLIAARFPDHPGAQAAAAQSVLRYKGMQGEEDALLNRLVAQAEDNPSIARQARDLAALRSDLAAMGNAGAGGFAGAGPGRAATERLEQDLAAAEAELQRLSGQFARQLAVRGARIDAVQARLGEAAVLVEYRLVRQRELGALERGDAPLVWHAVLVAPDRVRTMALASGGEVAVRLADVQNPDLLRDAATLDAARQILSDARAYLWEELIAPLDIDAARQVFLAPEGALTLVPFLVLETTEGGLWADPERRRVSLLPSGRALLADGPTAPPTVPPTAPATDAQDSRRLLAIGGVAYGEARTDGVSWPPLPGTTDEIEAIAGIAERADWQVETLSGVAAREDRLRARLAEGAPAIVHLATHGFFRDASVRPDRLSVLSGVALAGANAPERDAAGGLDDGTLYAIEVEGLNLQTAVLIVVSACKSALGPVERGEGVHGLNRAFRIAGAPHSLVTLRSVGDRQTPMFMETFYRHLFRDGNGTIDALDPGLAFQRTIAEMSRSPDWIDIGAFTLMRHR